MLLVMLPFRICIGILVTATLLFFTGVASSIKMREPATVPGSTMGHSSFMARLLKSLSRTFIGRPKGDPTNTVDNLMNGRVFSKRPDFMDFAKVRGSDRHMVSDMLSKLVEYAPFNIPFYLQRYVKELGVGNSETLLAATATAEKGTTRDVSATLLKVSGMINILFLVGALFIA